MPCRCAALVLTLLVAAAGCSRDPDIAKREYVRSGDRYVEQQKFREAIVEYRNAVQQDPRFGEARLKLADAYLQVGEVGNAYREYVRAADLLPEDFEAQLKAGELLLLGEQYEDAQARAERALVIAPGDVKALIVRANALAGLNNVDEAIADIEEAIRSAPDQTASYASLGAIQMMKGNRDEAEAAFRKAVETDRESVQARLALANFFWTSGRWEDAEGQLKAALQIDARDALVNRALAYFYLGSDRPVEAEPYFKVVADVVPGAGQLALADFYIARGRAAEARPIFESLMASDADTSATARLRLAALNLDAGDPAAAEKLVEAVLSAQPLHTEALMLKAQMLVLTSMFVDALAPALAAVKADPRSAAAHFMVGRVRGARNEPLEAISAYTEALRLNPRLVAAEIELARMHLAAQQIAEADQYARSAVQKVPNAIDAHLLLARVSLLRGDLQTAESSIKQLVAAAPNAVPVQTELGFLQLAKRDRAAARLTFEKLVARDPAHYDAVVALTRLDLEDGRPETAMARLNAALGARPADSRFLLLMSGVHGAASDLPGQEAALRRAIEVDAGSLQAYGMLGAFYAAHGRLAEATAEFQKLADKQPQSVPVLTVIAMLLEAQSKLPEAQAQYERVLAIDSRAPVAANNLAWLYAARGGNLDIALHLAQTAKSQLAESPEVDDTLGWIYLKKGVHSLAISSLAQAVAKSPTNPTFQFHLGQAYAANGAADQARGAFERALALNANFAEATQAREALAALR
jgi:tetratricopeptide (TPR) repeat protein